MGKWLGRKDEVNLCQMPLSGQPPPQGMAACAPPVPSATVEAGPGCSRSTH